jgi:hypothetical protein
MPTRNPAATTDTGTGTGVTIAFLHIPKTAGQTVHNELARAIGAEAVSPVRVHTQADTGAAQFPPGYRLYSGHLDWQAIDTLPEPRFTFTVLRDPLERIASFYFFVRREAESVSAEELAKPGRRGLRMALENGPDDYFFGGTPGWRHFIRDHYHSTYCTYLVTRRMRGHSQIADLDMATLVTRAQEAARGLDGVYSVDGLDRLEHDLDHRLGIKTNLTGRFANSAPDEREISRWAKLETLIERDETREKLLDFAYADQMLLHRLGMGPEPHIRATPSKFLKNIAAKITRPSVRSYPKPAFPEDATMFFGIGAQKAGTSWLFDYLSRSPEVHFSRNKELHYFDVLAGNGKHLLQARVDAIRRLCDKLDTSEVHLRRDFVDRLRNAADLLSIYTGSADGAQRHDPYIDYLLAGRRSQPVVGDITPAYSILKRADFADMASIGRARFIFILRDPVSRMWSQIRMAVTAKTRGQSNPDEMLRLCVAHADMLRKSGRLSTIERANYLRTMTELEAAVPPERILYVFYEDLFTGDATAQICDFLGIAHRPPDASNRVNEGTKLPLPDEIRALFREAFDKQYAGIRARFGDRVPTAWLD